jgi:hypothetical protein
MSIAILSFGRAAPDRVSNWFRVNLASRRSRVLFIGLVFTLAAAGLTLLDARDAGIAQELHEKQRQLARIEQLGQSDLWHQRRVETDLPRVQAEARLWEAETDGLAQANFQSWILEQANKTGIRVGDIRTSINATANNPLKLRLLTAQLGGRFDADSFFKLLQAIAGYDRIVVIDRLEIQAAPVPHFEMVLGTFLRPAPKV